MRFGIGVGEGEGGVFIRRRDAPRSGAGEGDTRGLGERGGIFCPPPRAHACPRQAYHTAASLSSGLGCESPPL